MKFSFPFTNLSHYGDMLAIPLFALMVFYFYNINQKTPIEYILFSFAILGFIFKSLHLKNVY